MCARNPANGITSCAESRRCSHFLSSQESPEGWFFSRQPMQRVRNMWRAPRSVSWWHVSGIHATQSYSIISSTSALVIRIWSWSGALGRSYSSRVYFRKLHHALRRRRSAPMDISMLWLTFPKVYELVRLVLSLADCIYAEYGGGLRHPL